MHSNALPTPCSFVLQVDDDEEGEEEEMDEEDEEEESAADDCTNKPLLPASEDGICRNAESRFVTPFGRSALYLNAEICVSKPKHTRRVSTTVIFAEVERVWLLRSIEARIISAAQMPDGVIFWRLKIKIGNVHKSSQLTQRADSGRWA
jgi:hypothetical protein